MNDLFYLLKKNPEYDPNTSWDTTIKSWEENFLGFNKHNDNFFNPLESDYSFSNAFDVNSDNGISYLSGLFDDTLNSKFSTNKFTCINENCMEKMYSKTDKTIKNVIMWHIDRGRCDCVSKPFLRLVLKPNLTEYDIKNLLYLLADCEFSIEIGGNQMFKLQKLLFAFVICKKLSNSIKIFNVKEFLETNTMEDIKMKIVKFTDKSCKINQKYYVRNSTDIYIDIPLFVDFFSYNLATTLVTLPLLSVVYKLTIPPNKVNMISNYLEHIVLMFEEVVYACFDFKKQLMYNNFKFLKMDSDMEYFHCWKGNIMELSNTFYFASKFIFVIVRQHKMSDIDLETINHTNADIDVSQYPQITGVELEEHYTKNEFINETRTSSILLDNIWVSQFDDMVIYGIAADGISNMKNWTRVQTECVDSIESIESIESISFKSDTEKNSGYTNFNSNNYSGIFNIVDLTGIKIFWSETSIQTNIEIFIIKQNMQIISSGMTGNVFSN